MYWRLQFQKRQKLTLNSSSVLLCGNAIPVPPTSLTFWEKPEINFLCGISRLLMSSTPSHFLLMFYRQKQTNKSKTNRKMSSGNMVSKLTSGHLFIQNRYNLNESFISSQDFFMCQIKIYFHIDYLFFYSLYITQFSPPFGFYLILNMHTMHIF